MVELSRFLRHAITPLVAILVSAGWLPAKIASDVTEAFVLLVSFLGVYLWSRHKEKKAERETRERAFQEVALQDAQKADDLRKAGQEAQEGAKDAVRNLSDDDLERLLRERRAATR